jgi:hypothetical protein
MHIKLICSNCHESLEAKNPRFPDNNVVEFEVDPCTSFECTPQLTDPDLYPELEPLMMPYATLVRLLKEKEVTVTYHKKDGEIRELTGHLGQLDGRTNDTLVFFHELVNAPGGSATQVKCLTMDRIRRVVHYDQGLTTTYEVMEAQ